MLYTCHITFPCISSNIQHVSECEILRRQFFKYIIFCKFHKIYFMSRINFVKRLLLNTPSLEFQTSIYSPCDTFKCKPHIAKFHRYQLLGI
jgi:hypothetical protein